MRLFISIAVVLAVLPLHAAETIEEETVTWYDVEIIVFRNLDTRSTETWPADAGVPAIENARPLFPPMENGGVAGNALAAPGARNATPTPFVPFDADELDLGGIVDHLERSSKYEPILHVGWTQPPLERSQAPYLRVTFPDTLPEPDNEDESGDETSNVREEQAPAPGEPGRLPEFLVNEETAPELARPLDGVVQLSVSRYLHLDLDLLYLPENLNQAVLGETPAATREWTEQERFEREQRHNALLDALARGDITLAEAEILALEPDQPVFHGFRLNHYRRLRSDEIHYFDHPVFGAIVKVTPREVPARLLDLNTQEQSR